MTFMVSAVVTDARLRASERKLGSRERWEPKWTCRRGGPNRAVRRAENRRLRRLPVEVA